LSIAPRGSPLLDSLFFGTFCLSFGDAEVYI
jgi:hypothetical protein